MTFFDRISCDFRATASPKAGTEGDEVLPPESLGRSNRCFDTGMCGLLLVFVDLEQPEASWEAGPGGGGECGGRSR
jgi:hypothetical protein